MNTYSTYLAHQLDAYLTDLRSLVNIDCPSSNKAGVDRAGVYVQKRAQGLGAEVRVLPVQEGGDCLYLRWRGRGHGKIFLIGHLDTVYPEGTVATYPYRQEAERLYGPGSIDMKAGLLAGMYAAHALALLNLEGFGEIAFFCNSDEEIGSPYSEALYLGLARDADAALVLEAARENGAIVSARKGMGKYTVRALGKAAHAGVEPEKGANAIVALARFVVEAHALNGMREGLTLSPGVIEGGTKRNVIPDAAQVLLDLRYRRVVDRETFDERLRELVGHEYVPGTHLELTEHELIPPMERTPATGKLVEWAKDAARSVGLDIEDVATGGGSDGNTLSALGLPVLDGLGPQGGRAHNAATEFVLLDSIVPRTAMLAELIATVAARRGELR